MLELWAWELYPGERHDSKAHPAGTTELLEVHAGILALDVGGKVQHVLAGGAALAATDRAHAYLCVGAEPVRWTMAVHEPQARRTGARRRERRTAE